MSDNTHHKITDSLKILRSNIKANYKDHRQTVLISAAYGAGATVEEVNEICRTVTSIREFRYLMVNFVCNATNISRFD